MGLRQRQWASRKAAQLREQLGSQCVDCGATEGLQFDCIRPVDEGHHRKMDPSWRMSFYHRQHRNGNLALRCQSCNASKGQREAVQLELAIVRHALKNWRIIKLEYIRP